MDEQEFLSRNMAEWRRRILNSLWLCAFLFLVAQLASMFLLPELIPDGFLMSSLIPSMSIITIILILCELAVFLSLPGLDFILMTGLSLATSVVAWFQFEVHTILLVTVIPIVVSLIYYNRELSLYVFALSEVFLVAVYLLNPDWRNQGLTFDMIAVVFLQLGVLVVILQVLKRGGQVIHYLRETTAFNRMLKAENVQMDRITKLDGLTGMYNHVAFHDYMDHLIVYASQLGVPPVLAIIDIDNFKKINDNFGHQAGDAALRSVAEQIQLELSPNDFPSRYGGEEFAIILVDKDIHAAIETMERIRENIVRTNISEIGNRAVTVSIGVEAHYPSFNKYEWFQAVDRMLYEAKHSGKNMTRSSALPAPHIEREIGG